MVIDRVWIGALKLLYKSEMALFRDLLDWRDRWAETLVTLADPRIKERAATRTASKDNLGGAAPKRDPLKLPDVEAPEPEALERFVREARDDGGGVQDYGGELDWIYLTRIETLAEADRLTARLALAIENASEDRARAADALLAAEDLRDVMRRIAELRAATARLKQLALSAEAVTARLDAAERYRADRGRGRGRALGVWIREGGE